MRTTTRTIWLYPVSRRPTTAGLQTSPRVTAAGQRSIQYLVPDNGYPVPGTGYSRSCRVSAHVKLRRTAQQGRATVAGKEVSTYFSGTVRRRRRRPASRPAGRGCAMHTVRKIDMRT